MSNKEFVTLESILNSNVFKRCNYELPIILGKTASTNEAVIRNMVGLRNILVCGASGQGKTTALHGMITSLLCKKQPADLRLVLIDPKTLRI